MSGLIIEPEVVAEQRKQKERAHQLERRGIARDFIKRLLGGRYPPDLDDKHIRAGLIKNALDLADEFLAATKVE